MNELFDHAFDTIPRLDYYNELWRLQIKNICFWAVFGNELMMVLPEFVFPSFSCGNMEEMAMKVTNLIEN